MGMLPPLEARSPTTPLQIVLPYLCFVLFLCSDGLLDQIQKRRTVRALSTLGLLYLFSRNLGLFTTLGAGHIADFGLANSSVYYCFKVIRLVWQGDARRFLRTGEKEVPPSWTFPRLQWSVQLLCAMRGVGWNWGVPYSRSWPAAVATERGEWLRVNAVFLIKLYAAMDVLHTLNQQRASFYPPNSIRNQHPLAVGADTLLAGCSGIAGLLASYHVTVFPLVLLHISPPEANPPLFGSSSHCKTVARFWSKYWHQLFRDSFVSLGGGTPIGAFAVSALLHVLPNFLFLRRLPTGSLSFFLLQPVGIWLERQLGLKGYWWTALWFAVVGGWLMDEYVQAGFWHVPLVPYSFCTPIVEALTGWKLRRTEDW